MNGDMKSEFEEYILKLTTSICKDIFLEEFKKLCIQMVHSINGYVNVSEEILDTKQKLNEELDMLKTDTRGIVDNLKDENVKLTEYTSDLFKELKEQHMNESKQYVIELDACLEEKKEQIDKMLKTEIDKIGSVFENCITRNDIQGFVYEIDENTKRSRELAEFINSTYKKEIEESIQEILHQTDEAQDEIHKKLLAHIEDVSKQLDIAVAEDQTSINKYAAIFQQSVNKEVAIIIKYFSKIVEDEKKERAEFLTKQEELIAQIGPKDEKIEQLNNRISEFEKLVEKLERDNDKKNEQIEQILNNYINRQEELDLKRKKEQAIIDKQSEFLSWKMYMTYTNTILMCTFVLLVILMQPWKSFGVKSTVITTIIYAVVTGLFIVLRKTIAKAIVKKNR